MFKNLRHFASSPRERVKKRKILQSRRRRRVKDIDTRGTEDIKSLKHTPHPQMLRGQQARISHQTFCSSLMQQIMLYIYGIQCIYNE